MNITLFQKIAFIFIASFLSRFAIAAERIDIIAGLSKPPFVYEETQTGIQLDIVSAAFAASNVDVRFTHLPLGRSVMSFQRYEVQGLITIPNDYEHNSMYVSKPYIRYQNVAVSLLEKNYDIKSIQDLSGKSIMAFQRAKKYLGEEYSKTVEHSLGYREAAEQKKQLSALFYREAEVIILDANIFKYLLKNNPQFEEKYVIHAIFGEYYYSAGFKTEALKHQFDSGIDQIKSDGTYQKILDKYLKK